MNEECIRPGARVTLEDGGRLVGGYVDHDSRVRLRSDIGYVTPLDKLKLCEGQIWAEGDRRLEEARR